MSEDTSGHPPDAPEHEHLVNEFSRVKWNGGNPVFLCGFDRGECDIIVCFAEPVQTADGRQFMPGARRISKDSWTPWCAVRH